METEREGRFTGDGVISGLREVLSGGDGRSRRDVASVKERRIRLLSVLGQIEDDGHGVSIKVFSIK